MKTTFFTQNKNNILSGNILTTLLMLSFPIMLNQLLQTFYNIADSYFMGLLGSDSLAASAFTFPIFSVLTSLGSGFSVGGMIIFSKNIGSNNINENQKAKSQLIIVNIIVSILIMIFSIIFSKNILSLSGAKGSLLELSNSYMTILFLSTPFLFIVNAYSAIENAKGNTLKPMLLIFASTIFNVIFNSFFLYFGKGIEGIAIATVIASLLLAIFCFYSLIKQKDISLINIKIDKDVALNIIKLGIPVSLSSATASLGFVVLNKYVIVYGNDVLAAFGIGNRLNNIFYTPANGISTGISIMVAQNLGAKNFERINLILKKALIFSSIIAISSSFILFYYVNEMVAIFTKDPSITEHSINYLTIFIYCNAAWAIYQVFTGYFQGFGMTKLNFYVNLGRVWIFRIPVLLLIEKIFKTGSFSVWYAMLVSNILVMILAWIIYIQKKNKEEIYVTTK